MTTQCCICRAPVPDLLAQAQAPEPPRCLTCLPPKDDLLKVRAEVAEMLEAGNRARLLDLLRRSVEQARKERGL